MGESETGMHTHEETPPFFQEARPLGEAGTQRHTQPLITPAASPASTSKPLAGAADQPADNQSVNWVAQGRQDAAIMTVLYHMSLGHLVLGFALTLLGVIMEAALHQPAFFGLAASGGMLGACGLITLLALNRPSSNQSMLGFYLLPYADFAIVGLWLLLFGITSPILLCYTYVIVSAALLLGNRHAITLAALTGAATLAISLEQFHHQVVPAIVLSQGTHFAFTVLFALLDLGLITCVAALFSSHLDRFITASNQQRDQLDRLRQQMSEQHQQIEHELELIHNAYTRFTRGEPHTRAPVPSGMLALVAHSFNALFEQIEQLMRVSNQRARLEERIGELQLALERLNAGDANALQALSGPSGTSLDQLTVALVRVVRQLLCWQQVALRARSDYAALQGLTEELTALRQTLAGVESMLRELMARSAQSSIHLQALLEGISAAEGHHAERPFLREWELRTRQQSSGLELLYARMGHIGIQIEAIEQELQHIVEGADQLTKRLLPNTTPPIGPAPEPGGRPLPAGQLRTASGSLASGPLKPRDLPPLPRRFVTPTGPLPETPKPASWQISSKADKNTPTPPGTRR